MTSVPIQLSLGATEGLARKEAMLALMAGRPWAQTARELARRLLAENGNQPITIDDLHALLGEPPRPNEAGGVFRSGFRQVGFAVSEKPHGHGNLVRRWVRKENDETD